MRILLSLLLVNVASVVSAQEITPAQKAETLKWVLKHQRADGGFSAGIPREDGTLPKAGLRETSSAVRIIKHLRGVVPQEDKTRDFVLSCYDARTGAFAEPGEQPSVASTSTGVMAAMELGIARDKFSKAMDYLHEHATTFEEVRIAGAAVEAWGVKDCPFKLSPWQEIANKYVSSFPKEMTIANLQNGEAREWASVMALNLRLGLAEPKIFEPTLLSLGQRNDGGWSKLKENASDLESTYRVMRAMMLLKSKPKDMPAARKFVQSLRNADGGYGVRIGESSSLSGTYYAMMVSEWLDAMEKL